jgi:hypothetical protein
MSTHFLPGKPPIGEGQIAERVRRARQQERELNAGLADRLEGEAREWYGLHANVAFDRDDRYRQEYVDHRKRRNWTDGASRNRDDKAGSLLQQDFGNHSFSVRTLPTGGKTGRPRRSKPTEYTLSIAGERLEALKAELRQQWRGWWSEKDLLRAAVRKSNTKTYVLAKLLEVPERTISSWRPGWPYKTAFDELRAQAKRAEGPYPGGIEGIRKALKTIDHGGIASPLVWSMDTRANYDLEKPRRREDDDDPISHPARSDSLRRLSRPAPRRPHGVRVPHHGRDA